MGPQHKLYINMVNCLKFVFSFRGLGGSTSLVSKCISTCTQVVCKCVTYGPNLPAVYNGTFPLSKMLAKY